MTKCPYDNVTCISGKRYRAVDKMPEYKLPVDLPGMLYVGECHRCVKVDAKVGDSEFAPAAPFIALAWAALAMSVLLWTQFMKWRD